MVENVLIEGFVMDDQQLRHTLVNICRDIDTDDLEKLKFLMRDVAAAGKLEKAEIAIDIFSAIEYNKHVTLRDGHYLAECFCLMGRKDLVKNLNLLLKDIEDEMLTAPRVLPFRTLMYRISEDISDKELEHLKFYSKNNKFLISRQLEKVKSIFDLFVMLEKATYITHSSTGVLKEMLRLLDRGELLDLVDEYQDKYPQSMDGESAMDSATCISNTSPLGFENLRQEPNSSNQLNANPQQPEATVHRSPGVLTYEMTANPRGHCVIINNVNFHKMGTRTGTDVDAFKLREAFIKLGFKIQDFKDLTAREIVGVMTDISQLDHSKHNALVVCILSHGEENCVFGVDEVPVHVRYLTRYFRSSKCKTLANKPKIFFIQACQGMEKQSGLDHKDLSIQHDGPSNDPESFPESDAETITKDTSKIIPDESDFLIGFATVPGYVSFRSRTKGSFYIQKLTENLDKYAGSLDLVQILTQVNYDLSEENIRGGDNGEIKKQVPMPQFTLRKQLYFNPDNLPPTRTMAHPSDTRYNSIDEYYM